MPAALKIRRVSVTPGSKRGLLEAPCVVIRSLSATYDLKVDGERSESAAARRLGVGFLARRDGKVGITPRASVP